jgi:uncharacterized membrane protein YphA (DoxX/SURF4 family)
VSLRDCLASPPLTVRVQIVLGILFIAAALPKLLDPPSFAHMIYNYRILPGGIVNPLALVLPWLELLCGVALVLGIWDRTASALVGFLLLAFTAALTLNLLRGNAIDCGCFDVSAAGRSVAERLSDMRWDILRDTGLLLMVAQILFATRKDRSADAVSS